MAFVDLLLALLVVSILGVNFVAIKLGVAEVPPLLLTGLRFFFAAVPCRPPKTSIGVVMSFGFVLGVVQFGLLFFAIHIGMPAGLSSLIIQMPVFFTIALAYFLLKERPTEPFSFFSRRANSPFPERKGLAPDPNSGGFSHSDYPSDFCAGK
jgi:O-acetylserine/cysteine efflux transporter